MKSERIEHRARISGSRSQRSDSYWEAERVENLRPVRSSSTRVEAGGDARGAESMSAS